LAILVTDGWLGRKNISPKKLPPTSCPVPKILIELSYGYNGSCPAFSPKNTHKGNPSWGFPLRVPPVIFECAEMRSNNRIYQLYLHLLKVYGPPAKFWPQWCAQKKSPQEVELIALGAVLTQRTSWHNADLALKNLKKANLLSISKISEFNSLNYFTELIRPAGFYQSKPKRIVDFCRLVVYKYGSLEKMKQEKLRILRKKLLAIKGFGSETTDTILLYALDLPVFVVDEYTKRLVRRENLTTDLSYDNLQNLFQKNLPVDVHLFQNYHALIIVDQKGEAGSVMERI
jgi:endonuclease-3 related protein